jgi:hypothetical protein
MDVKLSENVHMAGIFQMKVFKAGILIEEYEDRNLIVNGARVQMAHLLSGNVDDMHVTQIAFGTNGTPPVVFDADITNQFAKNLEAFSYPEIGRVQFDWELLTTEDNGMAILEFGLLSEDGTLFARKTRTNPIFKESDISIEGHWTIIFKS